MMVYVCIDGCKVDGHAIAVVEFAGVLLQLFCATIRATSTYIKRIDGYCRRLPMQR